MLHRRFRPKPIFDVINSLPGQESQLRNSRNAHPKTNSTGFQLLHSLHKDHLQALMYMFVKNAVLGDTELQRHFLFHNYSPPNINRVSTPYSISSHSVSISARERYNIFITINPVHGSVTVTSILHSDGVISNSLIVQCR